MLSGDGADFVTVGEDGAEDDSVDGVNNKIPARVLPVAMELQEQQPAARARAPASPIHWFKQLQADGQALRARGTRNGHDLRRGHGLYVRLRLGPLVQQGRSLIL